MCAWKHQHIALNEPISKCNDYRIVTQGMVSEDRALQRAEIERAPVSASDMLRLVRAQLVHCGYAGGCACLPLGVHSHVCAVRLCSTEGMSGERLVLNHDCPMC